MTRQSGRLSTLDFRRKKIHARFCLGRAIFCLGNSDLELYIGANRLLSKPDPEGVLYYTKVLPRETSPQYPKPPSFISKLNKIAGHGYIDTPGTVYLEVFVDSPKVASYYLFRSRGRRSKRPKNLRILERLGVCPSG